MNTTENKFIWSREVIFWGAVWGFAEATLGYLLHLLPVLISGAVMFPIGLYCMQRAARGGNTSAVFGVALIAAMVKMINIFFPAQGIVHVVHPVVAILLESVLAYAFVRGREKQVSYFLLVPAVVIGWRLAFAGFQMLSATLRDVDAIAFATTTWPRMAAGATVDIALIATCLLLAAKIKLPAAGFRPNPGLSVIALVLALTSQSLVTLLG